MANAKSVKMVTAWPTIPSLEELSVATAAVTCNLNEAWQLEHKTDEITLPWRKAFISRANELIKGSNGQHIRCTAIKHVGSSGAGNIDRFATSNFKSRDDFLKSGQKNEVIDIMRTFFDHDAPTTTLGTNLVVGTVLFEGRLRNHVEHELRTRENNERRHRTCTSLLVSGALQFARWFDVTGLEDQRAALLTESPNAPLLYVHKIASPGVMGVLIDCDWLVCRMDMALEIMKEREVLLSHYLMVDVITEEWRLLQPPGGGLPQLYHIVYTHITLPGEACVVCTRHDNEDNDNGMK